MENLSGEIEKLLASSKRTSLHPSSALPEVLEGSDTFAHYFGIPTRFIDTYPLLDTDDAWAQTVRHICGLMGQDGLLLALVGTRGTGKTQMAAALGRYAFHQARVQPSVEVARRQRFMMGPDAHWAAEDALREERRWAGRYTTAMDMFANVRTENLSIGESAAIVKWAKPALLVIDEIQERGDTEFEGRILTNIIDKRYGMRKDTVLIGNLEPGELKAKLGSSIMSRMTQCGGIVVADWPSFRVPSPPA